MIAWPARCPASRHESLRRVRGDPTRLRGRRCAVGCHRDARACPKRPVSRRGWGHAPQREQPSGAPLSHSPVRARARLLRGTSSPATRAPRSYKRYCAAHALVSAPESLKTLIHARSDPHLTHRWLALPNWLALLARPARRPEPMARGAPPRAAPAPASPRGGRGLNVVVPMGGMGAAGGSSPLLLVRLAGWQVAASLGSRHEEERAARQLRRAATQTCCRETLPLPRTPGWVLDAAVGV